MELELEEIEAEEMVVLIKLLVVVLAAFLALRRARRWWLWWRAGRILWRQGVRGPRPAFLSGNVGQMFEMRGVKQSKGLDGVTHDVVHHATPEVAHWSGMYGKPYLMRWFEEPKIVVFDPELFREVLSKQTKIFTKSSYHLRFVTDFVGRGLAGVNGDEWSHHRSVLAPAFHSQRLKEMIPVMESCSKELVDRWKRLVAEGETEVEVLQDMLKLAADIISHTAFGSNYEKGERVFEGLKHLGELLLKSVKYSWLPFYRYYPSPSNIEIWKLRRRIDGTLLSMIRERREGVRCGGKLSLGNDLLGLILEQSAKDGCRFTDQAIVDECKTFYLAGHETSAALLGWAMFLLAINPEWQDRARAEARQHCINGFHDGEVIAKLKQLGMIINETLRLYPPAIEAQRAAAEDAVVKGLRIPKGTGVTLSILSLHHDAELWGDDVNEFNPGRFAEGAAKACKHTNAFLPFAFGPRVCLGQAFALMEAKLVLATLLASFRFKVSPNYRHNPAAQVTLAPTHGIQLLLESLS